MTYYQTQSVTSENDRQLSEKYRRLTEENNSLEVRIQTLHALAPEIIQRKEEYGVLLEKFEHLANQSNSFPSKQTPGLRDVGGSGAVRNGAPGFQSSLSWDFEALALKERKSGEPGNEAEVLEKIIARFENELTTNKIELELIQKQMQGQSENEKISKKEVRRRDNTEPMQEGETVNRMSYVTTSGQDISSTSTDKIQELENLVNLLNRRIEELLEKDQEMENRVNILNKQKEELLHVNHQWDEQYRLLKDDKDRTISEMKKKTNTQLVSEAELQGQDGEVSQQRNKQVVELTQKSKALSEEVARLLEKQQKTDQLWVSAKKMITEEREARTAACQQKQLMQERYKELENQLQVEKQTQGYLKQEIERLVSGSDQSSSGSPVGNLPLPSNVTEQIEMLKQQMCVYADDFANERSDRERIQAEREVQKENLKAYENDIYLLKEQVRIYQDNFDKERREKEKVQRQLRDRRQASDESSWYEVPPNDYMAMGVANPVQRRQYDKGGKAFSVILFAKARLLCDKPKDSTHSSTVHYDILEQTSFVKTKNGSVFIYGVFQSDEAREESTVLKEKSVRKENLVQRVHRVLKDVRFTDISTPRDLASPHASSSSSGNSSIQSGVTKTEKYYTQEETDKLAQKAVDRFQFEITILQLSTLLKQADSSRRKLTLTRLATTQVPFTILSLTGNSCNEDCLAVCGLKDCHVLTLSGSGSVVNHLALHPQLETGNFIIKAVWLPGSQTEIAIVTADSVKT